MRWPRSFFGRNLLLILSMFFVAQSVSWVLFITLVQHQRMERFAPFVVTQTQVIRAALEQQNASTRAGFIRNLQQHLSHQLLLSETTPAGIQRQPENWFVRWFFAILRPKLLPDQTLAWQDHPHEVLWLTTTVMGQPHPEWIGIPANGFILSPVYAVSSFFIISSLVALIGALLIQYSLILPLKALESVALRIGDGNIDAEWPEKNVLPLEFVRIVATLRQMQQQLQHRERERTIMLAGISHDLRTPLTKLWLGVEMLRTNTTENEIVENEVIEQLTSHIKTADHIITQFIEFARDGNAEPLSLCHPQAIIYHAAQAAVPDSAWLHFEWGDMPACHLRATGLQRIVSNLVGNAARHGAPPIFIQAGWHHGFLQLCVTDHGSGVAEQSLPSIAQAFTRANSTSQTGFGLGLAIVERLVSAHGGQMQWRNAPDAGFEVTICLRTTPIPSTPHQHAGTQSINQPDSPSCACQPQATPTPGMQTNASPQ
jgi:two-component system osmolarity sensor histidine kinase EnvZ